MSSLVATLLAFNVPFTVIPVDVSSHHASVHATVTTCHRVFTTVADAGIAIINGDTVRTLVHDTQFVIV